MNIPTVKFAEQVGYETVVDLARNSGMNMDIRPTPAVALGAYEVKPIEIAGAYTVFANHGIFSEPSWIKMIRDQNGKIIYEHKPVHRQVLDPRIAYMMVNLLEEVLRTGTGAGVRGRGFTLPAAGKTGTSHDGWFAGFTSELVCVVWVGYDDNRDIKLEGAQSALPIWTEFMKRAHKYREYRRAKQFEPPDGVVTVDIDPLTGKLASGGCGGAGKMEVFVAGTQPLETCNGVSVQVASDWNLPSHAEPVEQVEPGSGAGTRKVARRTEIPVQPPEEPLKRPEAPKRKGLWDRLVGVFK
jgi:penicillin-binding protein 1B